MLKSHQQEVRVLHAVRLCVKIKIMIAVGAIKILGVIVILYEEVGGKK
jgi:hypothetical protein